MAEITHRHAAEMMFVTPETFQIKSSSRIWLVVLVEKLAEESFTHVKYLMNPN